jgi:hypothetical protein
MMLRYDSRIRSRSWRLADAPRWPLLAFASPVARAPARCRTPGRSAAKGAPSSRPADRDEAFSNRAFIDIPDASAYGSVAAVG